MKHQEVRVNIWQMIVTSGSYLFLAMCAWVLLRLVNACFWLPGALKKQQAEEDAKLLEEWKLRQGLLEGEAAEKTDQLPEEEQEEGPPEDGQEDQRQEEAEDDANCPPEDGQEDQRQEEAEDDANCPPESKKTI